MQTVWIGPGTRRAGSRAETPHNMTPARPSSISSTSTSTTRHQNRLQHAASPYLLQHAGNPVDWYEWGREALQRAREEQRPIFLSIGYAACHWCHVMAHESFEDPAVAAVMNRYFINIKVDREERPDLDELYMQATMLMNQGQGGWPMSVWLTPELEPFFAGTYFPPAPRYGRPSFVQVCGRIGELWNSEDRPQLVEQAQELSRAVRESLRTRAMDPQAGSGAAPMIAGRIDPVVEQIERAFDPVDGGIVSGGSNKFPPSMALDLMLRSAARRPAEDPLRTRIERSVRRTLDAMARGGIYDHLAGGIARYSTDVEWHIPHFEKMLYDQALVSRAYLDAWQYFNEPGYAAMARGILDYVLADLRDAAGGFYCSRDADSEGEEGRYYVWTHAEILQALGDELGRAFCAAYDVRPDGNWSDPHAPGVPKNVLRIREDFKVIAKKLEMTREQLDTKLATAREMLLRVRRQRVPPGLDRKVLVEWNGLMIGGLARAGAALDEPRYVDAAREAASFILDHQRQDGRLQRSWLDGRKLGLAFLCDYATMIDALLELYEATFEKRWLEEAVKLNDVAIELYWDQDAGGYYFTAHDHERLLARHKDIRDGATPSGNSVQMLNLLRLGAMTGDNTLTTMAERVLTHFSGEAVGAPIACQRLLASVHFAINGPLEIAIVGDPRQTDTKALLRIARAAYLPNRVIMLLDPSRTEDTVNSPLLAGRRLVNGMPAAYVCRRFSCLEPATSAEALTEQLRPDALAG